MARLTAIWDRASALRSRCLSLAKTCSIGFRSGEYFRQKEQLGSGVADGLSNVGTLVALQVVHHNHVAGPQGGDEQLLHVQQKTIGIHRLVQQPRRFNPVMPQSGDEGHRVPVSVRNLRPEPLTAWRPSAQGRHIGFGPGLINEDQAGGINPPLVVAPLSATPGDVGSILFAGEHGFF